MMRRMGSGNGECYGDGHGKRNADMHTPTVREPVARHGKAAEKLVRYLLPLSLHGALANRVWSIKIGPTCAVSACTRAHT